MARFSEKFFQHKMCILIFCTTYAWKISHSKKKSVRYYQKWTWVFM